MSLVASPRPPRSDDRSNSEALEALEALIEEARRRAIRRRRWYAFCALVAGFAAVVGYFGFNHGGSATRPQARAGEPQGGAAITPSVTGGRWRAVPGLEGGDLTALAFDPRHPRIVFAADANGGVFKSTDGGRMWRALGIAPGVTRVCCLLVDPQHPRTVYAGTEEGIAKSTNGGATWRSAGLAGSFVTALAFDPGHAETILAGTVEGLFRSPDGGGSWRPSLARAAVWGTLAFDPADPRRVYVGAAHESPYVWPASYAEEAGVFASIDGGRTWRAAGLQGTDVTLLAVDPKRPSTLYAVS